MNSPLVNSPGLVQVRLQHTSDIRVELGSHERTRGHIVVELSSVGREASLDTQGVMVCLQDMELVIGSTECLMLMAEREVITTVLLMYWVIKSGLQFSLKIRGGSSPSSHCSVTMPMPMMVNPMDSTADE